MSDRTAEERHYYEAKGAKVGSGADCDSWIQVHEVGHEVVVEEITIPKSDSIRGGVAVTGFFDVEKIVCVRGKTLFLEKKLPFQVLVLQLES